MVHDLGNVYSIDVIGLTKVRSWSKDSEYCRMVIDIEEKERSEDSLVFYELILF